MEILDWVNDTITCDLCEKEIKVTERFFVPEVTTYTLCEECSSFFDIPPQKRAHYLAMLERLA